VFLLPPSPKPHGHTSLILTVCKYIFRTLFCGVRRAARATILSGVHNISVLFAVEHKTRITFLSLCTHYDVCPAPMPQQRSRILSHCQRALQNNTRAHVAYFIFRSMQLRTLLGCFRENDLAGSHSHTHTRKINALFAHMYVIVFAASSYRRAKQNRLCFIVAPGNTDARRSDIK
jgi:hypothetical protein